MKQFKFLLTHPMLKEMGIEEGTVVPYEGGWKCEHENAYVKAEGVLLEVCSINYVPHVTFTAPNGKVYSFWHLRAVWGYQYHNFIEKVI